jgi:hypothetical protein
MEIVSYFLTIKNRTMSGRVGAHTTAAQGEVQSNKRRPTAKVLGYNAKETGLSSGYVGTVKYRCLCSIPTLNPNTLYHCNLFIEYGHRAQPTASARGQAHFLNAQRYN